MPTYAQSLERIKEQHAQQIQQQQQAHQQELTEKLRQQELHFEARFDAVIANYHQACAQFEQLQQQCAQLNAKLEAQQQTLTHTQRLVVRKQEAINRLLPTYPYPLTPELQRNLDAA